MCKEKFPDYWGHLGNKAHQRRIVKNEFSKDIVDLCKQFQSSSSEQLQYSKSDSGLERKLKREKKKGVRGCPSDVMNMGVANCSTQIVVEGLELWQM